MPRYQATDISDLKHEQKGTAVSYGRALLFLSKALVNKHPIRVFTLGRCFSPDLVPGNEREINQLDIAFIGVHSSIDKSVFTLGLGGKSLRKIPVNERFEMDAGKFRESVQDDKSAGFLPFCAVATVGTTSTTSVDPIGEIAEICGRNNIWLHVDAAYAGSAAVIPEFQKYFAGCERADSIVVNPHKWLFTPFDLSVLYCKDLEMMKKAFSLVPEYLKTSEQETVKNGMDYGIQLGRRFRSLKLWFVVRYFGQEGLIERIREHCRLACLFANWVDESDDFEMLAPVPFALICFRACPKNVKDLDALNEKIMNEINASGEAYLSHTKLDGKYTLRLSVGSIRVEKRHVQKVWDLLNDKILK